MSVNLDEAKNIRRMMEQIVRETVRSMPDFLSAFRTYKATVVTAPANRVCTVRLVGEDKTMTIPYSSYCEDVQVGDIVFVGVIANSLNNAFVFQRILLPENYGNPIEYLFYTKTAPTAKGSAIIDSVRGNSLVWNQLVKNGDFSNGTTNWTRGSTSITWSVDEDGALDVYTNGTTTYINQTVAVTVGHKYYVAVSYLNLTTGTIYTAWGGENLFTDTQIGHDRTEWVRCQRIFMATANNDGFRLVRWSNSTERHFKVKDAVIIDLTKMFGAGNEPEKVSEFKQLFPLKYYTPNAGTLLSFNGTALNSLSLPISTYFPDGMHSNRNGVYDELTADAATQRLTVRAYEAGDESNPDYVTDGTNTIVPLATPIITPISPPLNLKYNITTGQTEAISPALSAAPSTTPMHSFIKYKL